MKKAVLAASAAALGAVLARPAAAQWQPRSWALGWAGEGNLYGSEAPSLRYVINDKNALEAVVSASWAHSNTNAPPGLLGESVSFDSNYTVYLDYLRKLAGNDKVQLNFLVEPYWGVFKSYGYSTGLPGNVHNTSVTAGIGAGLEVEYFVLPRLSLGTRFQLWAEYSESRQDNDNGAGSTTLVKSFYRYPIALSGQILAVRWYFGGRAS